MNTRLAAGSRFERCEQRLKFGEKNRSSIHSCFLADFPAQPSPHLWACWNAFIWNSNQWIATSQERLQTSEFDFGGQRFLLFHFWCNILSAHKILFSVSNRDWKDTLACAAVGVIEWQNEAAFGLVRSRWLQVGPSTSCVHNEHNSSFFPDSFQTLFFTDKRLLFFSSRVLFFFFDR